MPKSGGVVDLGLTNYDDVAFADGFVITLQGSSSATPKISLYTYDEYISPTKDGSEGVLEFAVTDTGLGDKMIAVQGARINQVQRHARAIYILLEKGTIKTLYRVSTDSRQVSSMAFGTGTLPAVSMLDFMETRGSIAVVYQDASTGKFSVLRSGSRSLSLYSVNVSSNSKSINNPSYFRFSIS